MIRTIRYTARLYRIAWTLARHDALFPLELLGVSPLVTSTCKWLARSNVNEKPGKRLVAALEALGPSWIKLGQALSVRPDLVGDDIAADMSDLRDQIPPFDTAIARQIIEEEFEQPLEALFASFEDTPVAAASIAQVHFARTAEGREVAVKVLRPGIKQAFFKDVEVMLWLAELAERRVPSLRRFSPVRSVETFARSVEMELDLRYEAASASELKENTAEDEGFYVPEVDWHRTGQHVLTTERVDGIPLGDMAALKKAGINFQTLVEHAATSFFKQVFRDGFFHADLHPGNLFVLPDNTLAAVDFGIMGRIDRDNQIFLAKILWGFLKEDYDMVARVHVEAGIVPKHQSVEDFALACRAIAKPILNKPLNEISVGRLLGQLFNVARTFDMHTKPELLLLQKNMVLTEGVGRILCPEVNMWEMAKPMIAAWAADNLSKPAQMREAVRDTLQELHKLPVMLRKVEKIVDQCEKSGLTLSPETLAALRSSHRSSRQWLWFAWAALILLGSILVVELSLLSW